MSTTTTTTHSPSDLKALVSKARAAFGKAVQSDRDALLVCAAATFSVFAADMIGKGKSEIGGWESQRDYAGLFVGRSGSAVGQTTVVMWRRVGRAMSLGITPDTDARTFDRLVQTFGVKAVGEAADNGSKSAIVKAVNAQYGRDGKRVKAQSTGRSAQPSTDTETATDGLPVTRNNSTTLDAVETLLARITKPSKAERVRLVEVAERIGHLYGDPADFLAQITSAMAPAEAEAVSA